MDNILHGLVLKLGYLKDQYLDHCCFWFIFDDLSDNLTTNVKLFVDDTSLFSVVHNMNRSSINLNNDLNKIKIWALKWKINFDFDSSKQTQEVIFSRKLQKTNRNQVYFNHNSVKQVPSQKILEYILILNWIFRNT